MNSMWLESSMSKAAYVSPGMPALEEEGRPISFYEFWPTWLMYLPVIVQWLLLSVWYRSFTLPLLANPRLPISGMVGVPKSVLFEQTQGYCAAAILPWFLHQVTDDPIGEQLETISAQMLERGFSFPVVCKPDIGCRGSGVKLIPDAEAMQRCVANYLPKSGMLIQRLSRWEPEAGVFYVREPEQEQGEIISMALKYMPYVVGDGKSTVGELVAMDVRASQLKHLYRQRHGKDWSEVLPIGEPFRLVFSASHSRGAIFRDGNYLVTECLSQKIDQLMKDIPEFHYGRLDIKFSNIENLQQGKQIEIIEINAASSESLHIWDKDMPFSKAISVLLKQYRLLYKFGAQNRRRGYKTPSLKELVSRWKLERHLNKFHPDTD